MNLKTPQMEVKKFSQQKCSHLVTTHVAVWAGGFSTISERRRRRQQERLVLASEAQGEHCVWGAAAAGGSENRGSVKRRRCSAWLGTAASLQWGAPGEPGAPQPARGALPGGDGLLPSWSVSSLQPGQGSALQPPAGFPYSAPLPQGTEAAAAAQGKPTSRLASSAFKARRGRCCLGIALNCLLFLLIYQQTLPRYLRMQQKCLLFLDLSSVLSSCELQEGWVTQGVHYLLKRLFIMVVPSWGRAWKEQSRQRRLFESLCCSRLEKGCSKPFSNDSCWQCGWVGIP